MPISTRRLTEIRFMISDLLQRGAWDDLYNDCGTNDLELARSVANIFSMFDPAHVWKFVDHVAKLPADKRREKRDSTVVVCLTIGRIGENNTGKALSTLRLLLSDDHMLRQPVEASLSNMWVFDRRTTAKELFESWILKAQGNDDLQEMAVLSSAYLSSQDPKAAEPFLTRIMKLDSANYISAKNAAKSLVREYGIASESLRNQKNKKNKIRTKKSKHSLPRNKGRQLNKKRNNQKSRGRNRKRKSTR